MARSKNATTEQTTEERLDAVRQAIGVRSSRNARIPAGLMGPPALGEARRMEHPPDEAIGETATQRARAASS